MERYESLGVVGEGSYGIVLKCKNKETGQTVAVKKFLESEEDQSVKKIALREIRMLKRLRHENLINLIEFFRRKRRLYLVFEFVDHTVLDELENKNGGLELPVARAHIFQVIRGVSFCHENQIIHRDVKPENVLVSRLGVVKLCDFGFARLLGGPDESCTDYVATRWYRAPELLVGETKYGREVDVWAIGCLLSEMLTGDPLFPGESDIDQLYHIIQTLGELCTSHQHLISKNPMLSGLRLPTAASKPLSSTHRQWDARTQSFMSSCLELDPGNRPSAQELLENEYFTHDGFCDVFLVQLREKVQEEFGNVQLPPAPRKTSGQMGRKPKRPKAEGSPVSLYSKSSLKMLQPTPRSSTQKQTYVTNSLHHVTPDAPPTISSNPPLNLTTAPPKSSTTLSTHFHTEPDRRASLFPFADLAYSHALHPKLTTNTATTAAPSMMSSIFSKPNILQRTVNLNFNASPIRQIRQDKNIRSPHSLWLTSPKNKTLVVQGHGQSSTESSKETLTIFNSDTNLTSLSPFSRHQVDFSRHPYAVSLDRSKEGSSRDPLKEIKENSKDAKKDISDKEKKDVYRPPRSGWAKPRLLNDELFLPTVSMGNGKPSSPKKLDRQSDNDAQARRGKQPPTFKKSQFTMPTLNPIQRSSPSSAESFDFNRIASNLPFV